MAPKKVLITGVCGLIAGAVYRHLRTQPDRYDLYGLARRSQLSERTPKDADLGIPAEKFILADLTDFNAIAKAVAGMDVVVQLAADPRPDASWESLLGSNIVGPRNVLEAACRAGVRRVVFASSIMVSWGYQQEDPYKAISEGRFDAVDAGHIPVVTHEWPQRPTGLYPATKVWGEALARYYADVHNMSVPCLRIGWVNAEDHPHNERGGAIWCSQRDAVQMIEKCLAAPLDLPFDTFFVNSDNKWGYRDLEHARQTVGFVPADRAEGYR